MGRVLKGTALLMFLILLGTLATTPLLTSDSAEKCTEVRNGFNIPVEHAKELKEAFVGGTSNDTYSGEIYIDWGYNLCTASVSCYKDRVTRCTNTIRGGNTEARIKCLQGESIWIQCKCPYVDECTAINGGYYVAKTSNTTICRVFHDVGWTEYYRFVFQVSGSDTKICSYTVNGTKGYKNRISLEEGNNVDSYFYCGDNATDKHKFVQEQEYFCPNGQNLTVILDGKNYATNYADEIKAFLRKIPEEIPPSRAAKLGESLILTIGIIVFLALLI